MTGLEIVGASALYVIAVAVLGYIAAAIGAFVFRKGGLEVIPAIMAAPLLIWFCGAMGGLILLGRALA
ncbi:hypothetical protein KNLIENLN_00091 [Sinorhizobium phage NV1.1.1]|nr:hypothetical protein KNLIENLN_00091 [Sinorhizobium phage NV1.1.1]